MHNLNSYSHFTNLRRLRWLYRVNSSAIPPKKAIRGCKLKWWIVDVNRDIVNRLAETCLCCCIMDAQIVQVLHSQLYSCMNKFLQLVGMRFRCDGRSWAISVIIIITIMIDIHHGCICLSLYALATSSRGRYRYSPRWVKLVPYFRTDAHPIENEKEQGKEFPVKKRECLCNHS